mgnify:CR=1 FL=1
MSWRRRKSVRGWTENRSTLHFRRRIANSNSPLKVLKTRTINAARQTAPQHPTFSMCAFIINTATEIQKNFMSMSELVPNFVYNIFVKGTCGART